MIVVVGGIKGGSGKTTLATNLTVLCSQSGNRVLLVDADEQKSASGWAQQRETEGIATHWTTIQLSGAAVRTQIQKMQSNYDDIVIDVGGRDTTSQRAALTIADFFLIPFQPRSLDIWTLGSVKTLISEIASINTVLQSCAVINRADSSGTDNSAALEILRDCPNLICLESVIGQRKAFANAATDGLGVTEMKNQDSKAVTEIQALYKFLRQNDRCKIAK